MKVELGESHPCLIFGCYLYFGCAFLTPTYLLTNVTLGDYIGPQKNIKNNHYRTNNRLRPNRFIYANLAILATL